MHTDSSNSSDGSSSSSSSPRTTTSSSSGSSSRSSSSSSESSPRLSRSDYKRSHLDLKPPSRPKLPAGVSFAVSIPLTKIDPDLLEDIYRKKGIPSPSKDNANDKPNDKPNDKANDKVNDKANDKDAKSGTCERTRSRSCSRTLRPRHRRSPIPRTTKIRIDGLTRTINKDHLMEIFGNYGKIIKIEFPRKRFHPHLGRGFAYIQYETAAEAEDAKKHMDGSQIDGQEATVSVVLKSGASASAPPHGKRLRSQQRFKRRSPKRTSPSKKCPPTRRRKHNHSSTR